MRLPRVGGGEGGAGGGLGTWDNIKLLNILGILGYFDQKHVRLNFGKSSVCLLHFDCSSCILDAFFENCCILAHLGLCRDSRKLGNIFSLSFWITPLHFSQLCFHELCFV